MHRPGSSEEREARLKGLVVTGQAVQEYVYYPRSFEPLGLIRVRAALERKGRIQQPEKRIYFYHNDVNGAPAEADG
jgi:hypothetical protein